VYEYDTDGSFKIAISSFQCDNNHALGGRKYKATQGLWQLLTKFKADKNVVTLKDRQA
jgi:hypothetical protein